MILAALIYLGAHVSIVTAPPAIINGLAIGAVATEWNAYSVGLERSK